MNLISGPFNPKDPKDTSLEPSDFSRGKCQKLEEPCAKQVKPRDAPKRQTKTVEDLGAVHPLTLSEKESKMILFRIYANIITYCNML